MRNMRLTLFGTIRLAIDGESAIDLRAAKAQALLGYLAGESDRPHNRAVLQALLWSELSATGAKNALRVTLYRLRAYFNHGNASAMGQLMRGSRKGGQLSGAGWLPVNISLRVRTLGREIGIDNLSAHDCRR